ncbi:hypothetical protein Pmani_026518 [Petrolisthes manimaculis]|uniref:PH domain-containing protein n=1 Tax=Petrolisthes manimaculis TaxID=1843537 RepID=A0AAE1P5W5_9EUCA|nr:hypothetical protein Pmani_026518 [Petrolisthes manimaculis]
MEIVHEGMLKKSPPPKPLFRAKWRTRWFVLRSGELPGQYFLEYYTDHTRRKLKGRIDLDQCDQVDAGITFANRKSESDFKYMFDIKTPKRVYYLCAETEQEMNKWVDCVCHVCGLKIYNQEDEYPPPLPPDHLSPTPPSATPPTSLHHSHPIDHSALDSPPLSPSSPGSSISGPYIPISSCFTGKRTPNSNSSFPFGDDLPVVRAFENHRSSIPNEMAPSVPILCHDNNNSSQPPLTQAPSVPVISTGAIPRETFDRGLRPSGANSEDALSVQSPLGTEGSSVFSEDEWVATPHKVETRFFSEGSRSVEGSQVNRDSHTKEGSVGMSHSTGNGVVTLSGEVRGLSLADEDHQIMTAPPRPPKPAHLAEVPQQTYQNLESFSRPAALVRRNSSNDKVKNGYGGPHVVQEGGSVVASDPEPSPVSVGSSLPPSTPREVNDEMYVALRPQQYTESLSPQAAERNKQRHCYNNLVATPIQGQIFSYDVRHHDKPGELDPRISPASLYSNIPQSNKSPVHPPVVDRGLKPRKTPDTTNSSPAELSPPASGGLVVGQESVSVGGAMGVSPGPPPSSAPPIVDRNLKPLKNPQEPATKNLFVLEPAPGRLKKHNRRKPRAAPSPTPPMTHNGRGTDSGDEPDPSTPGSRRNSTNADDQVFFPRAQQEIQYLDLDLDPEARQSPKGVKGKGGSSGAVGALAPSVVYKKVDFVKTEVFNKMRMNVEDTYRKNQ